MIYEPKHFDLQELACPHAYDKYGAAAWQFFSPRLLITLDFLREKLNKPIYVNNWQISGSFDERGFRCIQCDLVKKAIAENRLYVSPHMLGRAIDFDVQSMTSEEVRQWIIQHQSILPYPIRLEKSVNWVHLDVFDANNGKVYLFNS